MFSLNPRNRINTYASRKNAEIAPEDIFLDASNLPSYDTNQFEGRLERPISKQTISFLGVFFVMAVILFGWKSWFLQIHKGEAYADISENNRLREVKVFSQRGVIYDRSGIPLAWNEPATLSATSTVASYASSEGESLQAVPLRKYTQLAGFSNLLGYVSYPRKDSSGVFYQDSFVGKDGVEKYYDEELEGENGAKLTETDALGNITSESIVRPPKKGRNVTLAIDSRLQSELYRAISQTAGQVGFKGGAGAFMDIRTGELLALASYPEYDSQALSDGSDTATINGYLKSASQPFLNRPVSGLYTPGSIIKPFVALAALSEKVIDPQKKILSTGSISIPNPYDPTLKTTFRDWKAHGWVNMYDALAVSSDVYFYVVGGGYADQKGVGIANIEKYARMFGIGEKTGIDLYNETDGTIPNPTWKAEHFEDGQWRLGNTYHTAIGQYGFQVTPVQMLRAVSAIANGGNVISPHVLSGPAATSTRVTLPQEYFDIVRKGMRQGVNAGTAIGLNTSAVAIAAKTGTAELGVAKAQVNSWVMGFFPYDAPKYAFVLVMEQGPVKNLVGATSVARKVIDWMTENTPEYLQ